MDNKCPKCGQKLGLFYMKQNCPNCGVNIMYYNMEERLEEDAAKAEAEYARFDEFIEKRTPKFIKKLISKEKKDAAPDESAEEWEQ